MGTTAPVFALQFPESKIAVLAQKYKSKGDAALSAGTDIAKGNFSRTNLTIIFEWKTRGRGRSRLVKNTDDEIADALRLAVDAKTPRAAISVLTGLNGVGIPVASALLAAINPSRYTIIDWRVMQALGLSARVSLTLDLYLSYLEACLGIASRNRVTLRDLDRAMWHWSKDRGEKR